MLEQGDIMKLGRVTVKIRKMVMSQDQEEKNNELIVNQVVDLNQKKRHKNQQQNDEQKLCRICFVEEDTVENPLLTICDCAGSMQWIHFDCMRQWLKNKLVKKETRFSFSFDLKNLVCELCKSPIPGEFYLT